VDLVIKIKDIPAAGAPLSRRFAVPRSLVAEALTGTDGDVDATQLECSIDFTRDHDEVFGRGRLRGALVVPCSRCLEPARVPVDTALHLQFSHQAADEDEAPVDGEDELAQPDLFRHDGNKISLEQPLREIIIAELPITALCKKDCLGLCARCGADRNTPEGRACGHSQDANAEPSATRRSLATLGDLKLPS
jgi:uncharacterized protein